MGQRGDGQRSVPCAVPGVFAGKLAVQQLLLLLPVLLGQDAFQLPVLLCGAVCNAFSGHAVCRCWLMFSAAHQRLPARLCCCRKSTQCSKAAGLACEVWLLDVAAARLWSIRSISVSCFMLTAAFP